jgi:GNAT superfamily N-acetyltransferase
MQIRQFEGTDQAQVRELFVVVNRQMAPTGLREAFEAYIDQALSEEICRIPEYYAERSGGFWVAVEAGRLLGTFGLEQAGSDAMELRRMYVDPAVRRRGIASAMLECAEAECRRRGVERLVLSTSELQREAIALYEKFGFSCIREERVEERTHKTVGGGLRRFHYEKRVLRRLQMDGCGRS